MQPLDFLRRHCGRFAAPVAPALAAVCFAALLQAAPALSQTQGQPAPGQQPQQQQAETQTFQDWTLACLQQQGQRACRMLQNVANEDGQVMMQVAVFALPDGSPGLLINLPLGVWLPEGVMLRVDGGEQIPVPYARCLPPPDQCRVEIVADLQLIEQMKAGTRVSITFWDPRQQPVNATVSLLGFTAAFNALAG
jgi:invasion protein IalB